MRSLLLLQLGRLGDLVQTIPLLRRCKEEFPGCAITMVCLESFRGILEDCGYCDRFVAVDFAKVEALSEGPRRDAFPAAAPFDAFPELRETYDLIVNLTHDVGSGVMCEKIAAARKMGRINAYQGELRLLGFWPKYLFAMVSHRKENLFNLVDLQMGMADLKPVRIGPSLGVPDKRRREAEALLASAGRRGDRRLVALQTGASELQRAWALEHFVELARRLLEEGNIEILLLGDDKERERADRFRELLGRPVADLVGKTGLAQLPAVLKACDLLVSNDTGTIHVAAGVGTPTVGLFFSTAYYSETAPYGEGHVILQVEIACSPCSAHARCPVQICREHLPAEAVRETVLWVLDPSRKPPAPRPNLSLYRSRFLDDGSLLYFPVHSDRVSRHYQTGLLGRLLWQGALDLPVDACLRSAWARARGTAEGEQGRNALAGVFADLELQFRRGLEMAGLLRREFSAPEPNRSRIMSLHGELSGLGASMAGLSKEAGLFGSFLLYEMMDMDYAPYPGLAVELEEKYRKLSGWVGRFRATLLQLSAA